MLRSGLALLCPATAVAAHNTLHTAAEGCNRRHVPGSTRNACRDNRSDSRNLNFVATVANYEYLFLTYLYQVATLHVQYR